MSSRRTSPIRSFAKSPINHAVFVVSAVAAPSALAQTGQGEAVQLPAVSIEAQRGASYRSEGTNLPQLPVPLRDVPQSVTTVTEQLMKEQNTETVRDALRNVSGISFNAGEGGASGDNVNLRGFSARGDFMLDGLRDTGQYTRDSFNLQELQVLKGPSSTLFGRGSTGGVINQVSKQPVLGATQNEASLTVGTTELFRGTADLNYAITEKAAVRLNVMGHTSGSTRDHVEFERWGVAPSLKLALGSSTELLLSYFHQREDNVPDNGVPFLFGKPAPVGKETFYGLKDDFEDIDVNIGTVRVDHRFNDNFSLSNTLRYGVFDRSLRPTAPRIAGSPGPTTPLAQILVNRGRPERDAEDTLLVNQTNLTSRFATGSIGHTLVTGIEYEHSTSDAKRFGWTGLPQASLLNPNFDDSTAGAQRRLTTDTDVTADSIGVYALDQIKLTDEWQLQLGVRWDRFEAESEEKVANTKFSRTDTNWSYRAGVIYQPATWQSYYFSYGTSFNPSAELLSLSAQSAGIAPEKNRAFELGARWDILQDNLSLRSAIFRIEKTNARTVDPTNATVQVLEGEQRVDGIELEAAGRILPEWNVFASYTYLSPKITKSNDVQNGVPIEGNEPQNVPHHTFRLWTTYDITPQWQIGGGPTYVSRRYANNANTNVVPSHLVWDATAAYRLEKYEVRLNVYNLTNETYYESIYPGHAVPANGVTALLSVNVLF